VDEFFTHIAHDFTKAITSEDVNAKNYIAMREHDGWKMHLALLTVIRNGIVKEVLSKQFTALDSKEKDIVQRSLHNMDLMIDFLMNPVKQAEQYIKLLRHNQKMEASIGSNATSRDQKGKK